MFKGKIKRNVIMLIYEPKYFCFSKREKYEKICKAEEDRQEQIRKKNRIENQNIDTRLLQGLTAFFGLAFVTTIYKGFSYAVKPMAQSEKRKSQ